MKTLPMSDTPDDLPSVGTHRGNDSPGDLGQTISSPEGPDPSPGTAHPADALFQLVTSASGDRVQMRVHSARTHVSPPAETDREEIGQYRTVDALRDALDEAGIEGWTGVFENPSAGRVLTAEVSPDHSWIGSEEYTTITFFPEADAAADYAATLDLSAE